jgi:hypothetical protein
MEVTAPISLSLRELPRCGLDDIILEISTYQGYIIG